MNKKSALPAVNATIAAGRTIRVSLPTSVANDLATFQKVQASILDRLGCPNCTSGYHIHFDMISSFSVDDNLNIREISEVAPQIDDIINAIRGKSALQEGLI